MKMFVNFKNSRMFAVSYINAGSGRTASNDSGFFISDCNHIGYSTPSLMLNGSTAPCECRTEGKAMPFFYSFKFNKHFYSVMSYTENNVLATNNSTCQNTQFTSENGKKNLNPIEIWKDIPNYEGYYQVSNLGNVKRLASKTTGNRERNLREKILKPAIQRGYRVIALCLNGKSRAFRISRLVASLFCENPDNKPQVDHIDGNKLNDSCQNLRWVTAKENCNNPVTVEKVRKRQQGNRNFAYIKSGLKHNQSAPIYQLSLQGEILKLYGSISEAIRDGHSRYYIDKCCNHIIENDGLYRWEYADNLADKGYCLITKTVF